MTYSVFVGLIFQTIRTRASYYEKINGSNVKKKLEMDDEFAAFMAEINSVPTPKTTEPVVPKKRGLPAAYQNRAGLYESQEAKTRRIEKQIERIDSQKEGRPVDQSLAGATISAAPVRK